MVIMALLSIFPSIEQAHEPLLNETQFSAEAMILVDVKTGTILYSKNENDRLYPASITKIMTALIAIESNQLNESVTTSQLARYAEGNRIYLEEGEEKPLIDLLYGLMLNSGNDAAIAIAEHMAGSVEGFSNLMNERAKQLGATQTNFITPNGLHDEQHYTTALDMATIARQAMLDPIFREIVSTKMMPWFGDAWQSNLVNANKLLWTYEGATGMKTGYTSKAQQTIVTSAERDGTELIAVLLKVQGRNNLWGEAANLLDFGFAFYETKKVKSKGELISVVLNEQEQQVALADDLYITVEKEDGTEAGETQNWKEEVVIEPLSYAHPPKFMGERIGVLNVTIADEIIAQEHLLLTSTIYSQASLLNPINKNLELQTEADDLLDKQVHFSGSQIWYIPFFLIILIWLHQTQVIARTYRRDL